MLKCPICLEIDDGMFVFAALKCGHVFHRDCISSWLAISKNRICPVCRKYANSFLNLYFFSSPAKTNEHSISKKQVPKKCPSKRKKKKFSTHQRSTHQYQHRSTSNISNNNHYWLRVKRS